MEDIGLFNQGWKWVETESSCCCSVKVASGLLRKAEVLVKRHWPNVCYGCGRLGVVFWLLIVHWKDCVLRGFKSFFGLGTVALLVIIWSCFLSLTSMSCLLYVLLSMVPCPPEKTPTVPKTSAKCPKDTLKFGVCGDWLGLVHEVIGAQPDSECCSLVKGLADLEAALCLCTAIKANVLGVIKVEVPVALSLLVNSCGKKVPEGFKFS